MSDETRPKRRKLSDFPCVADFFTIQAGGDLCHGDDPAYCPGPEHCAMLPIYEQAIADNRCARLLRVFERRWMPWIFGWLCFAASQNQHAKRFLQKMNVRMRVVRSVLRDAGLLAEEG